MKQKILILVGPTSSGKSALAVELARAFNGEVVSADSRQVYKGLDIGTGKITKKEMRGVPHHLLDIASPKRAFTAYDYVQLAQKKISSIYRTKKLPIVTGGTGFYIDALVGRVSLTDVPPNRELRRKLQKKTAAELFKLLRSKDVKRAKAMDTPSERNNKVRLIRALEIAQTHSRGRFSVSTENRPLYDVLWVGVALPKNELHKKIRIRLFARLKQGMVGEAKRLHKAGLSYKRMEELGLEYRALASFLQGSISRVEMIAQLERDIGRYAKRQMTYWKRKKEIRWFKPSEKRKIKASIKRWR